GDHHSDHVAGDRKRDRPHRRHTRLRRRARLRPERRPGAGGGAGHAAHEGDHARAPVRPAVRPRPDPRSRRACGRGRRARGRERVPRAQDRRPLRGHVLLAVRDEVDRRRRGRDRDHERRRAGRVDPRADDHAPWPRLALRHRRARLQGEPLRRARLDRPVPAGQGRAPQGAEDAAGRALRRRRRRAGRDRAGRPRPARHTRAPPVSGPCRPGGRRDPRRLPYGAGGGEHRHQCPLPVGPRADRLPRAVPGPAAAPGRRAGRRRAPLAAAVARALRGGHRGRDRGAPPRARLVHSGMKRRSVRIGATLVVTGLCTAYIVWKIDIGKTIDVLRNAQLEYFFGAIAIMIVTVWPMAWRWQKLLAGRGIHDRLRWLVRAYFTAYTAGQVLPTSVGGDAMRIFETSRRHPGHGGPSAGALLLERALGGAATLTLAAVGFVLAIGHYDVGAYLWVELGFVLATFVLAVMLFSRR